MHVREGPWDVFGTNRETTGRPQVAPLGSIIIIDTLRVHPYPGMLHTTAIPPGK